MLPDSVSQPMQLPLLRGVFASARTPVSLLSNCDFQPAKHESVWANVAAPPLNLGENHVSGQITIIPKPELRDDETLQSAPSRVTTRSSQNGHNVSCPDMSPRCDVN